MAEQTTVEQQAQATPPNSEPMVEQQPLTEDSIREVLQSGDKEKIENTRRLLFEKPAEQPEKSVEQPSEQTPEKPTEQTQAQTAAEIAARRFKVSYHGEQREVDDADGYLGHGSLERLKRSKAHADFSITKFREREAQAIALAEAKRKEAEQHAAELAELRKQHDALLAAQKQIQPDVQPPPVKEEPQNAFTIAAPELPDLPVDPTDWSSDDAKAYKEYLKKNADYNREVAKFLALAKQPPAFDEVKLNQLVEERIKHANAQTLERLSKAEQAQARAEEKEREVERRAQEDAYWRELSDFQALHKEFNTPLHIREQHTKMDEWMDNIAEANGFKKPLGLHDASKPEWQSWMASRASVAFNYNAGDANVIAKTDGIDPPKGYKEYFKLADQIKLLKELKDRYVSEGKLGPNAGYHQVYVIHADETGKLDDGINELRKSEFQKGAEAVTTVVKESSQYAPRIPNDTAQQGTGPSIIGKDDIDWAMNMANNPREMAKLDANGLKRYKAVLDTVLTR